jgi:glycosyltransferase involved in cell wall biosynthesis
MDPRGATTDAVVDPFAPAEPVAPVASVVLCVRNGAPTLGRQLAALAAQDVAARWELLLVDNGSTDGTGAVAASWQARMPWLRIVAEPVAGLNRARNRGVAVARADRILCCDADDEVDGSWVRKMLAGLERFDVVGGALVPFPDASPAARSLGVPQVAALPTMLDHEYAVGANLGFHRDVHDALGGFDPSFDQGADEVDFCVRATRAGFTIGFVRDARVRYTLVDRPGALARQRFAYGRGLQRLLAKADRERWFVRTPGQRWRDLARTKASLAWTWPRALRRDQRLPYLALLAHGAGEATELVVLVVRTRPAGAGRSDGR